MAADSTFPMITSHGVLVQSIRHTIPRPNRALSVRGSSTHAIARGRALPLRLTPALANPPRAEQHERDLFHIPSREASHSTPTRSRLRPRPFPHSPDCPARLSHSTLSSIGMRGGGAPGGCETTQHPRGGATQLPMPPSPLTNTHGSHCLASMLRTLRPSKSCSPAASTALEIAVAPSFGAGTDARAPPKLVIGVRT